MNDYVIPSQKMSRNIQRTVLYAMIRRPRKEGGRHRTSEKHLSYPGLHPRECFKSLPLSEEVQESVDGL